MWQRVEGDKSREAVPEEDMLFPLRSKVSSDLLSHSDPAILRTVDVKRSSHINTHTHTHTHRCARARTQYTTPDVHTQKGESAEEQGK